MYCSVKFLSPIVTGGLPLPGCAAAVAVVDDLLSLDPQAASERASAAASRAAMLRNQVRVVTGSSSYEWWGQCRLGREPAGGIGWQFGVGEAGAQRPWGDESLQERE